MNRNMLVITMAVALAAAGAAPALAQSEETRELDADTDGVAQDTQTGERLDATVNVTGDVTVRESGNGVDETAESTNLSVVANVTVGDTTYEIPVLVVGEGTSLEQAGITAAESWRLSVQGTQIPDGDSGEDNRDTRSGDDAETGTAQFQGNLTLVGNDEGGYQAQGNGTLTVADGDQTTTYRLDYSGQATFE